MPKAKKRGPQKKAKPAATAAAANSAKAEKPPPLKKSQSTTDWETLDFSSAATTKDGRYFVVTLHH